MMQSTFCSTCQQPLPGGAIFCANCGAPQQPASAPPPASQPSSGPSAETIRAGAPPSGAEYAPTMLQPPPAPAGPTPGSQPPHDLYASQYPPASPPPPPSGYQPGPNSASGGYRPAPGPQGPMMPPAPGYAPGPPPVAAPGGAQPAKKRSGLMVALGCLLALVVLLAVLGGGGFLLVKALSGKHNNTSAHQGSGTATPSASSTTSSTPGSTGSTQTLANINRQAIYGGATFTIVSAKEAASFPELQQSDPTINVLDVQIEESNQIDHGLYPQFSAIAADGTPYLLYSSSPSSLGAFWNADTQMSGDIFFKVPKASKVGDFVIQIGNAQELPVLIPLTGAYDPSQWQPVTYPINKSIKINIGRVTLTVMQIVVVTWNPGFQAPKGMRLFRMYLHAENDAALAAGVGGGNYELVFPDGSTAKVTSIYGSLIDTLVAPGESKDVGYDTFLVPPAPAHYTMNFFNSDGTPAGQIDLGTV